MTLSTARPPVDVAAVHPEFARLARTTVRLHPRRGAPGPRDSSLGGPLLWPAGEPWPSCGAVDHEECGEPAPPLVAVLQLFAHDVPELPFPEGTDVMQLLWCPGLHGDGLWPWPVVRWRAAASVSGPLSEAPEIDADGEEVNEEYVPRPCVLEPERVSEYPDAGELDPDLRERVTAWSATRGWRYSSHLAAAPGTKVGGWPDWIQEPEHPACDACGRPMSHLLTVASWECDGESWRRWVTVEDFPADRRGEDVPGEAFAHQRDAGLSLADAGSMYLLCCTSCPDRPVTYVHQSC